jgi:hypothetical protein
MKFYMLLLLIFYIFSNFKLTFGEIFCHISKIDLSFMENFHHIFTFVLRINANYCVGYLTTYNVRPHQKINQKIIDVNPY